MGFSLMAPRGSVLAEYSPKNSCPSKSAIVLPPERASFSFSPTRRAASPVMTVWREAVDVPASGVRTVSAASKANSDGSSSVTWQISVSTI